VIFQKNYSPAAFADFVQNKILLWQQTGTEGRNLQIPDQAAVAVLFSGYWQMPEQSQLPQMSENQAQQSVQLSHEKKAEKKAAASRY
jgi:hypothetical protein